MTKELKEGLYYLTSENDVTRVLVHLYQSTDAGCMVFGFNTHDGGGAFPLSDLVEGALLSPVRIIEISDNDVTIDALTMLVKELAKEVLKYNHDSVIASNALRYVERETNEDD